MSDLTPLREIADSVHSDLYSTDIPNKILNDHRIWVRRAKDGTVFEYPDRPYFEVKDKFAEYRDVVETELSNHCAVGRVEKTTRTDLKVNLVYYPIQEREKPC